MREKSNPWLKLCGYNLGLFGSKFGHIFAQSHQINTLGLGRPIARCVFPHFFKKSKEKGAQSSLFPSIYYITVKLREVPSLEDSNNAENELQRSIVLNTVDRISKGVTVKYVLKRVQI